MNTQAQLKQQIAEQDAVLGQSIRHLLNRTEAEQGAPVAGLTHEQRLLSAATLAHGRCMSSVQISTLLHSVARLCAEHDSPNVVGFDDAAVAVEQIVSDLDKAQREPWCSTVEFVDRQKDHALMESI